MKNLRRQPPLDLPNTVEHFHEIRVFGVPGSANVFYDCPSRGANVHSLHKSKKSDQ